MDVLTKEQRRKTMQAVKSCGSKIETSLQKALWKKGYRYRKNCKSIMGKPDIVLRKFNLVIFCDSEFWHGKNWTQRKKTIHTHKKFWFEKIERNIRRDELVTKTLRQEGWKVMRFWGKDIEKKLSYCVSKIEKYIQSYERKAHKI